LLIHLSSSFELPFDVWYLIDKVLYCEPKARAALRQVCRLTRPLEPLVIPRPPNYRAVDPLGYRHRVSVAWSHWLSFYAVCSHCLYRDKIDNMRPEVSKYGFGPMFYRCWACLCLGPEGAGLTKTEWKCGELIVWLERTELEPELTKDGLAHSVKSYEDAICSEKPAPRGYKIRVGPIHSVLVDEGIID